MNIYGNRAVSQAVILAIAGLSFLLLASANDWHERLMAWLTAYELYQLDELLMTLNVVGFLSIVYACLRAWDLRAERRRRRVAETRMDWMAQHDHLTGLNNRHSLDLRLEASGTKSHPRRRFTLLMIDLDGFKRINDLAGHHAGDAVLQAVSERLIECVPEDNIFRMGGDEFVVLVDTPSMAAPLAHMLLESLNRPIHYNDTTLDIGASIGMATWPEDGASAAECLQCADAAMYAAKAAGRGVLRTFDAELQASMQVRHRAERNLRHAIAYGGIRPFYQPIIDLQTNTLCGFEALARWQMEDGVSIPPADFIPLAEESGLIMQLTDSLLGQACRDAAGWPPGILLSFNISPVQLRDKLLGLRILKILLETGLEPHRLEVEITETGLIHDIQTAGVILNDLRSAGIAVALDDFGTGYSNLAQLSNLSFDKIKIDRSFVASFQDQERQEKIVKAIVGLGIGLDVPTTAEGIETRDQLETLIGMGCTFGQGYLFGKAMPAEEAQRLIAEGTAKPDLKAIVA